MYISILVLWPTIERIDNAKTLGVQLRKHQVAQPQYCPRAILFTTDPRLGQVESRYEPSGAAIFGGKLQIFKLIRKQSDSPLR